MTNKLYEYMAPERGHLVTESTKNGKLCMKGTFIQADIRNQNQRELEYSSPSQELIS